MAWRVTLTVSIMLTKSGFILKNCGSFKKYGRFQCGPTFFPRTVVLTGPIVHFIIVFQPISDKRLYPLYRTGALLYIKLYNTRQPDLASGYLSATFEGILYVTAIVG